MCIKILEEFSEFCNIVVYFMICYSCYEVSSIRPIFSIFCIPTFMYKEMRKWYSLINLMNFFHYLYHGKSDFLANIYVVNIWKSENNRPIVWRTINLLFSKNFIGKKGNSCYSFPSLGNPVTYVDVMKIFQSIMIWYMNILTLSYLLQCTKRHVT